MNLLNYIVWDPSNTALSLGPFAIHWYSLCWLIGLALAYIIVHRLYREQQVKDTLFDPLFIYCFIGILAGARLGHFSISPIYSSRRGNILWKYSYQSIFCQVVDGDLPVIADLHRMVVRLD